MSTLATLLEDSKRECFQAITTKYHGPTDRKGARISATANVGRVVISYPHELDNVAAHRLAAETLANKFHWLDRTTLVGGALPKNAGYVFVQVWVG